MSFTEVRFPENISYGSTGGPEFSTDIVVTQNGYEQRNINWSNARTRYSISYGVRSNELHKFVILPKRWVLERYFAWLDKCRRLWKNYERKLNTSLKVVVLSFSVLFLKDYEQVLGTGQILR